MTGAPDLVIFDCDGVLVDSEPIANRVFAERLATVGVHMEVREVMARVVGRTRAGCMELAAELAGRALPADFGEAWDAALFDALEREVRPVAGVEAVLEALENSFCVASNSSHRRLRLVLECTGLVRHFEGRQFSAADVARPKPAPDLFLHAAAQLGAAPARCIVVEDTPTGARAAREAGMRVLAYAGAPYADRARLAGEGAMLFDDMAMLPGLLRRVLAANQLFTLPK